MTKTKTKTWKQRCDEAEARGGVFTQDDFDAIAQWPSCICGEQDPRIPRHYDGQPRDYRMRRLGVAAIGAVTDDNVGEVREIMDAVEKRAAEILAEMWSKTP